MLLRRRMLAYILPPMLIILAGLIVFARYHMQNMALDKAYAEAETILLAESLSFVETTNRSYALVKSLSALLADMQSLGTTSRDGLVEILKNQLQSEKEIFGLWCIWEPNAFDGRDAEHAKASDPGSHSTPSGAVNLYWIRGKDGSLTLVPSESDSWDEDYYSTPKQKRSVYFTPVYIDKETGTPMFSICVPILSEGKVLGVAGADLALDGVQRQIAKIRPYESGRALLLGSHGIVVSAPDETLIGKPLPPDMLPEISQAMQSRQPVQFSYASPFSGEKVLTAFRALPVAENNAFWGFAVSVPMARITARSTMDIGIMTGMGVLGLCLITLVLTLAVARITRSLGGIVKDLTGESGDIGSLAEAASKLAQVLESDAASQSQAITDTSEAVKRITDQVRANAQAADQCGQAMGQAAGQVEAGRRSVLDMNEAMSGISQATTEMAKTLKTIETISSQTNLLALNAAVESARAGEAGAGFAVVADEVRKLAGRTSEAARKTAELIGEAGRRVGEGLATKERLEEGFRGIETAVEAAGGQVELIRSATRDQAQAVDSVDLSINELSVAVKRNLEASNQSSSSSRNLTRRASALYDTSRELDHLTNGPGRG